MKLNILANKFLEITNDIHLGLKFGCCNAENRRILKHNRKSKGFSYSGIPWILVYSESFNSKMDAMDREKQLKNGKTGIDWKTLSKLVQNIPTKSRDPQNRINIVNPSTPTNDNQGVRMI